jgi:hypothetical protein
VQQRVLETEKRQFLFHVTDAGRQFLLHEGTDQRYGARHLKRAIERHVVFPLANLLATEQVKMGDTLCIDWDRRAGRLVFWKQSGEAVSATNLSSPKPAPIQVVGTAGGRITDALATVKARGAASHK